MGLDRKRSIPATTPSRTLPAGLSQYLESGTAALRIHNNMSTPPPATHAAAVPEVWGCSTLSSAAERHARLVARDHASRSSTARAPGELAAWAPHHLTRAL
jgi:hypothetical protein